MWRGKDVLSNKNYDVCCESSASVKFDRIQNFLINNVSKRYHVTIELYVTKTLSKVHVYLLKEKLFQGLAIKTRYARNGYKSV